MTSGRMVYLNGEFVPERDARISIFDSALMFGDMVFEMTRSFNKVQFKLEEHIERLYSGIRILRIPMKLTKSELLDACLRTVEVNEPVFDEKDEHRLMINVSRGPLGIYSSVFDGRIEPTVVIADFPLKWTVAAMGELYDRGINSVIPSQRAIPATLLDPKIKNRSRMWYQMANIEVSQVVGSNNWALLIDPDGFIAEGTGDNFFMVKDNVLITPEGRNILRGISRDYVIQLAKNHGIEVQERNIEPYDVYCADEAFLTATPFCILPTTHLNGLPIGNGVMGPMTRKLLRLWSDNVGVDIERQIRDYGAEVKQLTSSSAPTPYQFKQPQ